MIKQITSLQNDYIKYLYRLHEKKYRLEEGKYLIEGYHLIEEAKDDLETVLITDNKDIISGVENILVTSEIIKKLAFTSTPQNIIGVCKMRENELALDKGRYLLLDNIQDPGNLGTLVRSALAFDIDYVIVDKGVDIYNEKFIRATQGAFYHIAVVKASLKETLIELKRNGIAILGTDVEKGKHLSTINQQKYALLLGNEGQGLDEELKQMTDLNIYIPTNDALESLNVAIAGSIIMYHLNSK